MKSAVSRKGESSASLTCGLRTATEAFHADANNPVDIADRGAAYRNSGWSSFDPDAPVYTAEQVTRERSAYGADAIPTRL